MIKFIVNYLKYQEGTLHDLGCVKNMAMVRKGVAVWIKVKDIKLRVK